MMRAAARSRGEDRMSTQSRRGAEMTRINLRRSVWCKRNPDARSASLKENPRQYPRQLKNSAALRLCVNPLFSAVPCLRVSLVP